MTLTLSPRKNQLRKVAFLLEKTVVYENGKKPLSSLLPHRQIPSSEHFIRGFKGGGGVRNPVSRVKGTPGGKMGMKDNAILRTPATQAFLRRGNRCCRKEPMSI